MEKQYLIEVMYDNGLVEQFETSPITEKAMSKNHHVAYLCLKEGINGVLEFLTADGSTILIYGKKITRFSYKECDKNN